MTTNETNQAKIEKPHAHFEKPHEVVADPTLSKQEKVEALDTLEQDARLLGTATAEGMTGDEQSDLHEVLDAKEALELLPIDSAYAIVLRDLRSRRCARSQDGSQALVERAIEALEALASTTAGDPPPGSEAEIAKEAGLEKLDP